MPPTCAINTFRELVDVKDGLDWRDAIKDSHY
jgi:hypothetical protein